MIEQDLLDRVPLLENLGASGREVLSGGALLVTQPARTVLWRAGSPSKGLFIVLDGRVRVVRSANGRQHLVHVEEAGGTMGEVPLFDGLGYPATAVTDTACEFLVVPVEVVHATLERDREFSLLLLERLGRRVRGLVDRLQANTLGTVRSRLAGFLIGEATLSEDGLARWSGSQSELAEDLGTAREVVARELSKLVEEGLVARVGRGTYRVLDDGALTRLAT